MSVPASDNYQAIRDQNRVPVAQGQSNVDSSQTLPFLLDHVTGRLLVDSSGGSATIYAETPSGLINGSNTTYTTAHTMTTVIAFAINGQFLHPTSDYTFTGTTITFVTALPASLSGLPFTIAYT